MKIIFVKSEEWQGLMDAVGTNYYTEIAQMRPVLESIHGELLVA